MTERWDGRRFVASYGRKVGWMGIGSIIWQEGWMDGDWEPTYRRTVDGDW